MLAALWWGGITALAFVAVPVVFATANESAEAGRIAAQIFVAQSFWSIVLAAMIWGLSMLDALTSGRRIALALCAVVALALANHYAVSPLIVSARSTGANLALWHGIGSALVAAQWVLAGWVNWRLSARHSVFS
jgi:hypothetical protein